MITDYLEARSLWDKYLKNTPSGGLTTHVQTEAELYLGYRTDERGRKVPFNEVCLIIDRSVQDARGNPVITDPSGRNPSDTGCLDITPAITATIATDLSMASVTVPALPLTHVSWVCPDGPTGDCSTVDSPGPVVSLHATWTALKPLFVGTVCLDNPRQLLTIAERDANATATVDGADVGAAQAGDEGVRIAHWIFRAGCPG